MRRPLCLLCLIYVFLIMLCMTFMSQIPEERQYNDQNIRFCGKVYNMGVKNNHTVIYLKNSQEDISVICYLSENLENTSQKDSEKTFQNLSENESDHQSKNTSDYLPEGTSDYQSKNTSNNSISKKLKIGNTVVVQGKVRQFASATNDGQFDMKEYYAVMGIDFSMTGCRYEIVSETYWPVRHGLYVIKNSLSNVIDASMSKEDAGVLKAMLFGDKTGMDEEIKELYQRNGIAHIIAVSGLHITLWGMGLCRLLRKIRIPLSAANSVSFLFVVLYGLLTGSQASAVRSIIMFSLYLFAEIVHRTYDLMTAMSLSAALLLFWNPLYAYYSGFLLSFSAVAGIAFIHPFITGLSKQQKLIDAMVLKIDTIVGKIIKKIKKFIVSSFRVSLSVLLSTLPIQIYFFYTFSIYSLILNILITPFVGILMVVGMVGSVIGVIMPGMGKGILWFCHLILSGYEKLCLLFDNLPFAHPVIAKPEIHKMIIYYCVLFLLCLCSSDCGKRWMKKGGKRLTELIPKYGRRIVVNIEKYRAFLAVLLLLLNPLFLCIHTVKDTMLTMLDVGQGDCFVLEGKSGLCMMIDGGSSSVSEVGKYRIAPFLRSHGIQTVDFVFLTHADKDHTNGVLELLENQKSNRIVIRYLVLTDYAKENEAYQTILSAAQKSGTQVLYFSEGDHIEGNDFMLTCLYPGKASGKGKDDNVGTNGNQGEDGNGETNGKQSEDGNGETNRNSGKDISKTISIINPDENDRSMVLLLECQKQKLLFMGDLTAAYENEIMESPYLKNSSISLLKLGHHGSRFSSSEAFLETFMPKIGLVSAGADNSYGHPHSETLERLAKIGTIVYRTDELGATKICLKEGKIKIVGFKKRD